MGLVVLGLIELIIGIVAAVWPRQTLIATRWDRSHKPELSRGTLLVARLVGLLFVIGGLALLNGGLGVIDIPTAVSDRALVIAALGWLLLGIAMLVWPARVRSLTVPDWQRYEHMPFAATSLWSYRLTGAVFIFIATVAIGAMLSPSCESPGVATAEPGSVELCRPSR